MKKIVLIFSIASVLVSCESKINSKKGSWTSIDKVNARKEVEKDSSTLELVKNKEKCFNCYMNAIEKKYENNDSALKDVTGRYQILFDCAIKYLHY